MGWATWACRIHDKGCNSNQLVHVVAVCWLGNGRCGGQLSSGSSGLLAVTVLSPGQLFTLECLKGAFLVLSLLALCCHSLSVPQVACQGCWHFCAEADSGVLSSEFSPAP